MRKWVGKLCFIALASGAGIIGCGSSAAVSHKDAGQTPDIPSSSGGVTDSGGVVGSGGITAVAGVGGTSNPGAGGTSGGALG